MIIGMVCAVGLIYLFFMMRKKYEELFWRCKYLEIETDKLDRRLVRIIEDIKNIRKG